MNMNEKELGDALLKWDASKPALGKDPRELTATVLDRDRRRLRRLSILASFFWLLALAGILTIFVAGGFAFPFIAKLLQDQQQQQDQRVTAVLGAQAPTVALAKITAMNIVITSGSMVALVCAGLGTLILVRATRQATLRQVNAGLFEISEQLRQLRAVPPR